MSKVGQIERATQYRIIAKKFSKENVIFVYASEADLLNVALFGITSKEWRDNNPNAECNIRDNVSIEQLAILSNMESINAVLIHQGLSLRKINTTEYNCHNSNNIIVQNKIKTIYRCSRKRNV